jgi:hypothetical protein
MRRMNADLIRGIRGICEYPWFICPDLLWFDIDYQSPINFERRYQGGA